MNTKVRSSASSGSRMPRGFEGVFGPKEVVIACVHLLPLPGAPQYLGNIDSVYEHAISEAKVFEANGVHGIIIENFRDCPFFPDRVPPETIASMAAVARSIRQAVKIPVGVNVLRNDAEAAIAIAVAAGLQFIRVNVHTGAVVSDQGMIEGKSYRTLRMREQLRSSVLILADVGVKHAAPLGGRDLAAEAKDTAERGLADCLIVSGEATGAETNLSDVDAVRSVTRKPILIGSGATPQNLPAAKGRARGFIVGTYFKVGGSPQNLVDEERVRDFMSAFRQVFR